ncbi:MAG: hypothetical protein U0S50_13785 [Sphingopyxis sp.]|uniref:hypothetical protein n=1 Tax=Sphingopyxis sp. TaxID=1908224 RepID=UPI002ABA4AD7|nr:hypothetical protein [Sphingopyxis sp.]MDZ3832867.1 hypothetical protein [Sphingopyxis sp.]
MMLAGSASLVAAFGLALAPLGGGARVVIIPGCNTPAHLLVIPSDPAAPGDGDHCAKPCHAINDRRGKSGGDRKGCC